MYWKRDIHSFVLTSSFAQNVPTYHKKIVKNNDKTVTLTTIYGIKSATWRFLFKIRDFTTKMKGKKSATKWRFFYAVKKRP